MAMLIFKSLKKQPVRWILVELSQLFPCWIFMAVVYLHCNYTMLYYNTPLQQRNLTQSVREITSLTSYLFGQAWVFCILILHGKKPLIQIHCNPILN